MEGDASQVSDSWPFTLREIGTLSGYAVFEFDDGEPFFAFSGPSLNFLPKAGMTFDDLVVQSLGAKWIREGDPIDLSMSLPGDSSVPSGVDRRRSVAALGAGSVPAGEIEILEGLFLRG